uniref:Overexpressed in colon carcinoma 1 protein n=1 Tax=Mesocestoides corti TaxID=53468 RepID=A0A5K3FDX3_MESCO
MGCTTSSPNSVIEGAARNSNQNAGDNSDVSLVSKENEPIDVAGNSADSVEVEKETTDNVANLELKMTFEKEEPIVIKADTQDLIQTHSDSNMPEVMAAKKGYVAFEVNLDGQVDPYLDTSKRPLPKRLKALAIRKSGISRRLGTHLKPTPNQTGDAPRAAPREEEAPESESASLGTAENSAEAVTPTELKDGSESPESSVKPEAKEQVAELEQQMASFEVVDLYDSNNNNVSEPPTHVPQLRYAKVVEPMAEQVVVQHHRLNAVQEVDEWDN